MNNKVLGTKFEQDMCDILAKHGYWVHFITPDARGAQPFDIVAAKDDMPYAVECKTLTRDRRYFTIDRLEDNQILAFKRWTFCGNNNPIITVKQLDHIISFRFIDLIKSDKKRIDMYEQSKSDFIMLEDGTKVHGILKRMLES